MIRFAPRLTTALGLAAAALLPAACKSGENGVGDVLVVARVEVTPPSSTLTPQETITLVATPFTEGGVELPRRQITWTSTDTDVATVSEGGVVQARAVGGPIQIRATIAGVTGQASVTVTPVPVDRVVVSPTPTSVQVGASTTLTATAYAAGGAVLPGRNFSWQTSDAGLAAVTTTGVVLGVATGGPVTISASTGGKTGTASVTVTPRPATRLGFIQQPGPAIAGQTMVPAIRVAIQDDLLGTVQGATNAVTIALGNNPGGATLTGTRTVNAVNGVATFNNLQLDRTGSGYTLVATSGTLAPATSNGFDVGAGSANRLTFTTPPPGSAPSGVAWSPQPVLQLRDASGNPVTQAGVTVTASLSSSQGTLGGTTSVATNGSGTATFSNLSLAGPVGSYSVAFSAPGIQPISANLTLTAGPPADLSVETEPSATAQSGVPFAQQPVLQLRDQAGNAVSQGGVAVSASIALGPSGSSLGGGTVVTTNSSGRASFQNLSLSGPAGVYALRFSSSGLSNATSRTITLAAGAGTTLALTTQPSSLVSSGMTFPQQPVVQLRDAANNPVSQAGVLVTASIQTGGGTLGGTTSIATNASGAAVFTDLSISGSVGNRTLLFAAPGYVGVVSGTILVTSGAASQLSITTQPSSTVQSGQVFPQQPELLVRDGAGNPVGGVAVTATIASGGGTLGGTVTVSSTPTGVVSYTDLSISGTAGNRTLQFSAGSVTATSNAITVIAGAAGSLAIATQPSSSAMSGAPFAQQPVVLVSDAAGNPVGGIVVTAAIGSGSGTLGGTLTATSGANGNASWSDLAITGSGPHTLSFSATGLTSVTSGTITVNQPGPAQVQVTTQPSATVQNRVVFPQQPAVTVLDAANNPVGGVTVTAAIESGGGTLGGTPTAVTNGSGVATFSGLSISGTIGIRTLSFTAGPAKAVSNNIDVIAGNATKLGILVQPSTTAGDDTPFTTQPVIQLLDADDNAVAKSGVSITAQRQSGPGSLSGSRTLATDASGIVSYTNLEVSVSGTYVLRFVSSGLSQVLSQSFVVP